MSNVGRSVRWAIGVALVLASVAGLDAQGTPDHLKCFKVKDPAARKTYTANLDGLVLEPGCVIKVPAKEACVPTTKTAVSPTPPGGGPTGTPNAFLCYSVHCLRRTLPPIDVQDQFGSRQLASKSTNLVCAPATVVTTTTTMPCVTTTTIPVCSGNGTCTFGGQCPGSQSCQPVGPSGDCTCLGTPVPCGSVDSQLCQFGDCPSGMHCVYMGGNFGTCGHNCGCQ